jgi:carboxyl-terminal processing protease
MGRGFAGGAGAWYSNGMRRFFWWTVLLAAPLAAQEDADESPYREMKTLARAVELIRQDYVDEDKTEYGELIYSALRGMLEELDPHSDFMDPKDFKAMQEDTRSEFGGLGVVVTRKDDRLSIVAPMEGTPGFRAGLLPGDVLLEIDGQSAEKMSLRDAVDKLRGEAGTAVELAVGRAGESEPRRFAIEREVIKVPSVRGARLLDGDGPRIGYVRVAQFSEPTGKEFSRALSGLERQGMDALVLDLRFNPGGLLGSAVEVAGEFLPGGALVAYTEGRAASAARRYTAPGQGRTPRTYPVAVLVNGSSASGAEIVAGALKDSGRALLVGETTFGKGSVQSVVSLPDGSAVRLTTAKYFTPGRQPIHEKGVTPHISAPMSATDEARLLAGRRQDDLPAGTPRDDLEPVDDVPLRRAVDALRGVLLHAKGGAEGPSGEG